MASVKDLKKRIVTVKNTQQTTRAMKMVSAAKLRRAQELILNHRPYAQGIVQLIRDVLQGDVNYAQIFPQCREHSLEDCSKVILLVVVTSDRGLCGGFNSNVIKSAVQWIKAQEKLGNRIEIDFIGRKGHDFFKVKQYPLGHYHHELNGKVSLVQAKKISNSLVDRFLTGNVHEIKWIYNSFKNAVTQEVVIEDFLPFPVEKDQKSIKKFNEFTVSTLSPTIIFKPHREQILKALFQKVFMIQTLRILLESQAAEHGARMSVMENATKNAGEMIQKLTLQYNRQRQAGITKELLEIIAGSETQLGS